MPDPIPLPSLPQRPLTWTNVYERAYARVRRQFVALADEEPDRQRRYRILGELELVAKAFERDMRGVHACDEMESLARPEE